MPSKFQRISRRLGGRLGLALAAAFLVSACATVPDETSSATDAASANTGHAHGRAGGGHGLGDFFAAYDADGDGAVSRAEFIAEREAGYARRDANHDAAVQEDEYVAEYAVRLDQQLRDQRRRQIEQAHVRFEVLDADDDDAMSLDEFHASGARMFSALDSNADGVIDDADTANSY